MKNHFGLYIHPTDEYIHWTYSVHERVDMARKYRKAYDRIVSLGLQKELDILTEAAERMGRNEERDNFEEQQ